MTDNLFSSFGTFMLNTAFVYIAAFFSWFQSIHSQDIAVLHPIFIHLSVVLFNLIAALLTQIGSILH